MFMVPIFPARFKVGLDKSALNVMTAEEFEKLSTTPTALTSPAGLTDQELDNFIAGLAE